MDIDILKVIKGVLPSGNHVSTLRAYAHCGTMNFIEAEDHHSPTNRISSPPDLSW